MSGMVLVTGGGGFVAGWCIVELLKRGYTVRATLRRPEAQAAARQAVESQLGLSDRLGFVIADLDDDAGWSAAMAGCSHVLHIASPLGTGASRDLLQPARDGSLRVLRAALDAGVQRIVMTSAAAAARTRQGDEWVSDEALWPTVDASTDPYRRSKILAERAAWDFMAERQASDRLTTVLPSAVFGPMLPGQKPGSVQVVERLLQGRPPAVPRLGFAIVDVRDLARLHVDAMESPAAAGQRFIAAGEFLWMSDMARALKVALPVAKAARIPSRRMPDWLFKLLAVFIPPLRMLVTDLGRVNQPSARKARELLGFAPRPAAQAVVDCALSLEASP